MAGSWTSSWAPSRWQAYAHSSSRICRLFAGKRIWEAHREHIYQRAVQAGHSHSDVVLKVIAANAVLVALAAASVSIGWLAVPPGIIVVLGLLLWLPRPVRRA